VTPRQRASAVAAAVMLTAVLAAAGTAHAGRPCDAAPLSASAVERGMALAERTRAALDASGATVVLLARAGQDLSAYRLRWSHLGIAYRDGDGADASWRVLHKLNHCGTAEAALYRQGLGPFFLDSPFRYEAAFVALAPALAAPLRPLLQDNARGAQLHEPRYNMLAYPWATQYQQSNQWAIETLAMAALGAESGMAGQHVTRRQAQGWLQARDYQPTVLQLGPMTRLGARATRANVAFDDHPNDQRFADRIATVTVDSVFAWLPRAGLGGPVVEVR
jgi:hypothetical protein